LPWYFKLAFIALVGFDKHGIWLKDSPLPSCEIDRRAREAPPILEIEEYLKKAESPLAAAPARASKCDFQKTRKSS
jgi:hypothetical protein